MIVFFPILLIGCGISINAPSESSGPQSGGPLPSGPGGGQAVSTPVNLQPLTGCSNPNTGVSNGDWGTGSNPVFVNPWGVQVGSPVYKSNYIFWTSRETSPGQSILVTGAFTDATTKKVRIASIPPGTLDWQTLVKKSTTLISPTQQSTTGLSFIVPSNFPSGVYGFQIEDPTTQLVLGLANVPALNWAIGVPGTADPSTALMHQVYDCGVEPGEILKIYGKNFVSTDQVVLQSSSGTAYSLSNAKVDSNSIVVPVPSDFAPGTYTVWVGTIPWSATSSPGAKLTVYAPPPFTIRNVSCSNMVADGKTDNTPRLQSCLDWYAPLSTSREVVDIEIPPGTFILTRAITVKPYEVLIGEGSGAAFIGRPGASSPSAWFNMPQYSGMANVSLQALANPNLLISAGTTTGNPLSSGHLFFNNVHFASAAGPFNPNQVMFAIAGPDIQVYNSSFLANSNQDFDILFGDGAIVSGNQFILNNWTGLAIEDSQNVAFENNETYSQQPAADRSDNGLSGGSGLSITRGNSIWGQSALSRDVYVGYNTFKNMGSNSQQVVLNDGDGGSYYGPVASSTADTVTLAEDPWWAWMGTTNPGAASMAIVAGTGVGQYSFLKSYNGRTISVATPWKVPPDETSIVVISQYELYMTWAHNTLTNTLGASFVLADALESVIEDNVMTNSGQGILISAFGPYGGPASYGPIINTDVLRNTIEIGAGNDIALDQGNYLWGIGLSDFPGCLLSGVMVRGNVVPSVEVLYNTDGVNGVSANVIEQNQGNWAPTFPTPGFLVQDNSPPPAD